MDFLKNVTNIINPFGIFIFLVLGIFILLFFGISQRKWIRNFIFILVLIFFIGAFFINIYGYKTNGEFSNDLFKSGIFEINLSAFILYFAVVCFFMIFIFERKNDNYIKIVIVFLFSVVSLLVLVISRSFMSFFISFACFLISFFALTTILNDSRIFSGGNAKEENKMLFLQSEIVKRITRFFISVLVFMVLIFFGFSILYGVTDVRNFLQLLQSIESGGINIIFSLMIISIAFFIYLGIFPFQAPYISYAFKTETTSLYFLWLFYFPAGIAALLKFTPIILILNKNLKAGSYILYILSAVLLVSSIGSGIAGLKTKSLRKVFCYIFTLILLGYFINMLMLITGFIKEDNLSWHNIFNFSMISFCFLPLTFISNFIENAKAKDSIENIKSLIFKNKFIGIAFLILILSLIGIPGFLGCLEKKYYLDFILDVFNHRFSSGVNNIDMMQGWLVSVVIIIYTIAFTAVNIRLAVVLFMKGNKENVETDGKIIFSKIFCVLIGIFILLTLFLGIMGLLEILNPDANLLGFRVTNPAIFIKNLK